MQSWAAQELEYTNLPDKRLNQRLIKIVEQAEQENAHLREQLRGFGNRARNLEKSKISNYNKLSSSQLIPSGVFVHTR